MSHSRKKYYLLGTFQVGTVLVTLQTLSYLVLIRSYYPHLTYDINVASQM